MVVSLMNASGVLNRQLNEASLESPVHWRQSPHPPASSPQPPQPNSILNFSSHDRRTSAQVQVPMEDNSGYSSENGSGADVLSPSCSRGQLQRSSGSGEMSTLYQSNQSSHHLFSDSSNCDSEGYSQISPPHPFHEDDAFQTTTSKSRKKTAAGGGTSSGGGKKKVHKCRNCGFVSTNKNEMWKHVELHMNPDKILRCKQCPFVTPYKHHMDFHRQNHLGNKPFKCSICTYECVNKSMLKSHSKSHSNVYQYKCRNCTYKTKYCHSLKIHLRKYSHSPGPLLDAEGNYNPNSVIDVYGNRRGPKQKGLKKNHPDPSPNSNPLPLPATIPTLEDFPTAIPWNVFLTQAAGTYTEHAPHIPLPLITSSLLSAGASHFLDHHPSSDRESAIVSAAAADTLNNNFKLALSRGILSHGPTHPSPPAPTHPGNNNDLFMANHNTKQDFHLVVKDKVSSAPAPSFRFRPATLTLPAAPVASLAALTISADPAANLAILAAPAATSPANVIEEAPLNLSPTPPADHQMEDAPLNLSVSHGQSSGASKTNRRKGVARRYTLVEDQEMELATQPLVSLPQNEPLQLDMKMKAAGETAAIVNQIPKTDSSATKEVTFYCDYCGITFSDQIMYQMHMGYHGFDDPFTCNRCGEKTRNKIAFYLHMISAAH